ncbi:hypothetical protein [Tautonia sociabilis]|uniref:Uncharacterized protein n=1 Tax=Tautonia sociabilis TaxID=2080755 RepID=A0A432MLI4_9BACT|nr:hypothetical protein [Tautonia sociabilis]RUL88140.1 hypothetical protein TsocGM_08345 [Tautonia sociabilis]
MVASENQYRLIRSLLEQPELLDGGRYSAVVGTSTSRTSKPGGFWSVEFDATPAPSSGLVGEVDLDISGGGGLPTVITVRGETGGKTHWLSRLTDTIDAEGWPYRINRVGKAGDEGVGGDRGGS